jgi:hypothetical protein
MGRIILSLALITLVAVMTACSSNGRNPVSPEAAQGDDQVAMSYDLHQGHNILGEFTMTIDPENNVIEVVPSRNPDSIHFNVTPYLYRPPCPAQGCFQFSILNITGTVLTIELRLANPTSLTVYDVRQIFTNLYGKKVLNPDGYTRLFDPPSTPDLINPFIAFAKTDANRKFPGPWIVKTRQLLLDWPAGQPSAVTFIFECCIDENTREPYQIENQEQYGVLPNEGGTTVILADILDWQNDISKATLNTSLINGRITNFSLIPNTNTYRAFVNNYLKRDPGVYPALIVADSPNDLNLSMYHFVDITVSEAPFSDNMPVSDCLDCDASTEAIGQRCIAIFVPDIWIAYSDNRAGITTYHTRVQKSTNTGTSFDPSVKVSSLASSKDTLPSIAVDGDYVYVTWTRLAGYNSDVKFARSIDGGVTFNTEVRPHPDPYNSYQANSHIAVDGNGVVYICYEEDNFGYGSDIAMLVSTNHGETWSSPIRVNNDLTDKGQFTPAISADLLGHVAIVWEDKRSLGGFTGGDVYFSTTEDLGETFGPNIKVNDTSGTGLIDPSPAIALYLTGGAYITWACSISDDPNIYFDYSVDREHFGTDKRVNDDYGYQVAQYDPSINVNLVGTVFIAWTDERNIHKDVFFAESHDGVTFSENSIVNTDTTEENQFAPSITSDFLGRAYLTWSDARNTRSDVNQEIFFAFRR